jgi:hypothetical protein
MMTFTDDIEQRPPSQVPLAATALLVAAIVAAGFLLLQRDGDWAPDGAGGRGAATAVSRSRVNDGQAAIQPPPRFAAAPTQRADDAGRGRGAVVAYIAGSSEEAWRARTALNEADAVQHHLGMPPVDAVVVVAGSDEEALVMRYIADVESIRATFGLSLPAITVVDLRER